MLQRFSSCSLKNCRATRIVGGKEKEKKSPGEKEGEPGIPFGTFAPRIKSPKQSAGIRLTPLAWTETNGGIDEKKKKGRGGGRGEREKEIKGIRKRERRERG